LKLILTFKFDLRYLRRAEEVDMNRHRRLAYLSTIIFALALGCGDDSTSDAEERESESDGGGEKSSSSGGKKNTKDAGETLVDTGATSSSTKDAGQAAKDAGASTPKDAGSDAGEAAPQKFGAIEQVGDKVIPEINDLRGLVFSKDGNKLYASGHTDADPKNRKLVLARFSADGTLDTSFDGDGIVVTDLAPGDEQSLGVVELENGDLIVQANVTDGKGGAAIKDNAGGADGMRANGVNVWLVRFDSSGTLVTSWGKGGKTPVNFGWTDEDDAAWPAPTFNSMLAENMRYSMSGYPSDQAWGVVLDKSSGEEKLVVSGFGPAKKAAIDQRYDNDRYVARILASTGAPDPEWNGGSAFTFNSLGTFSDGGRRAIVEKDGTVISAGYTNFGAGLGNHVVLLRIEPDGTADADFGFGIAAPGTTRFNPFVDDGGVAECYSVTRQSKGRYITTGYGRATGAGVKSRYGYVTSDNVDLVSFGVKSDGRGIDLTYGTMGTLAVQSEELGLGGTEDRGRDLLALPDDRVVHVGRLGVSPAVFVTTPDGKLDKSVSDDGIFTYEAFPEMPSHFFAVAASADKKHIAAATSSHPSGVLVAVLEVAAAE
jgi:uncharacterized delta-60 repeat protein